MTRRPGAAINSLLADPARAAELGRAGPARAVAEFSWASIAAQTAALYAALATTGAWWWRRGSRHPREAGQSRDTARSRANRGNIVSYSQSRYILMAPPASPSLPAAPEPLADSDRSPCAGGPPGPRSAVRPRPRRRRPPAPGPLSPRAASTTASSTSGCGPRSPPGPAPTWTSSPPTCPRPPRAPGQHAPAVPGRPAGRWAVAYKNSIRRGGRWRVPERFTSVVYKGDGGSTCGRPSCPRRSRRCWPWPTSRASTSSCRPASGSSWTASGSARAGPRRRSWSPGCRPTRPSCTCAASRTRAPSRQHPATGALTLAFPAGRPCSRLAGVR